MLVLAVLRHADYLQPPDVPSAWLPWPLSERGVEQARQAAATIAGFLKARSLECLPTIDSSRMLRAWQTADIIGQQLQADLGRAFAIDEFEALAERSVGAVANLGVAQIEGILAEDPRYEVPPPGWKSMSDYKLPFQGAESLNEAGVRVAAHLEQVWRDSLDRGEAGLKIIVGHGASIRHAARQMGLLTADGVGRVSMHHAQPIFLSRDTGDWQIIEGNWKPRAGMDEAGDEFSAK